MSTPVRVFLTGSIFCGVWERWWADLFPGSIFCGAGERLWADLFPRWQQCYPMAVQPAIFMAQLTPSSADETIPPAYPAPSPQG